MWRPAIDQYSDRLTGRCVELESAVHPELVAKLHRDARQVPHTVDTVNGFDGQSQVVVDRARRNLKGAADRERTCRLCHSSTRLSTTSPLLIDGRASCNSSSLQEYSHTSSRSKFGGTGVEAMRLLSR